MESLEITSITIKDKSAKGEPYISKKSGNPFWMATVEFKGKEPKYSSFVGSKNDDIMKLTIGQVVNVTLSKSDDGKFNNFSLAKQKTDVPTVEYDKPASITKRVQDMTHDELTDAKLAELHRRLKKVEDSLTSDRKSQPNFNKTTPTVEPVDVGDINPDDIPF